MHNKENKTNGPYLHVFEVGTTNFIGAVWPCDEENLKAFIKEHPQYHKGNALDTEKAFWLEVKPSYVREVVNGGCLNNIDDDTEVELSFSRRV